ncbi:hypothetical protein CMI47_03320 [Candidatus Pacearchaeota archaeon]|nr:hypothetical protein [Candidatus Pacearchaeota archaeon]|tara:strand:- start:2643 stop:3356 length:714 start_codon:yes stop_codon:yes gene_type:complete
MFLCNLKKKEEYLKEHDIINTMLEDDNYDEKIFATHKWLLESVEKRMIYWNIYKDLLFLNNGRSSILDVGGGFSSLTKKMLKHNDYHLLDIMAHDDIERIYEIESKHGVNFFINSDWNLFNIKDKYDIIIANDLFPNVDQRLEMFLDKYLPYCDEMRLSLTYYNNNKSYKVKRVGADEVFNILAWDGTRLSRSLRKYKNKIINYNPDALLGGDESIFANGRQVCVVRVKGDSSFGAY